jgi:hypothetical protein
MGTSKLTDKSINPTESIIYAIIGDHKSLWVRLMNELKNYPYICLEWKYYRDAGRWLLPVAGKKKNLFWITLEDDTFKASFWFGNKVIPLIEESDLPETVKAGLRVAKANKMGKGLSISVNTPADLDEVFALIKFKLQLK